jgi:hypothetical protein
VTPPAVRDGVVLPRAFGAAEHAPAHDDRSGGVERFLDDLGIGVLRAAGEAVALTPDRQSDGPLVEPVAAFTQGLLDRPVPAGDEPAE